MTQQWFLSFLKCRWTLGISKLGSACSQHSMINVIHQIERLPCPLPAFLLTAWSSRMPPTGHSSQSPGRFQWPRYRLFVMLEAFLQQEAVEWCRQRPVTTLLHAIIVDMIRFKDTILHAQFRTRKSLHRE